MRTDGETEMTKLIIALPKFAKERKTDDLL
jgi:hypothetical protein